MASIKALAHSVIFLALLLNLTILAQAADPARGQVIFKQCAVCHSITSAKKSGPSLAGILGRKTGVLSGFRYSTAMKRSKMVWDAKTLNQFLKNPQAILPGNTMPFSGIADTKDREDLIAYLKRVFSILSG